MLGVAFFAATALVWVALFSHDPADDLRPSLGYAPATETNPSTAPLWLSPAIYPANDKIQNEAGFIGAIVSQILFQSTGLGAYLIALLLPVAGIVCFRKTPWASPLGRSIGWSLLLASLCALPDRLGLPIPMSVPIGRGGYLGALINTWLNEHLAFTGGLIFLLATLAIGILLSTEYALIRYLGFATTGGMTLLKALKLRAAEGWTRTANGTGIFSGRRSDLPASVTLRDGEPIVSLDGGPVPSFSDLAKRPFGVPDGNRPDDLGSSEESDGPAIRIGRRATSSFSSQDLVGGSKPIGRTDLSTSKSKRAGPTPNIPHEEDEVDEEQEFEEQNGDTDETVKIAKSKQYDESEDLEDQEEQESEDELEDQESDASGQAPNEKLRADPSHGTSSSSPRIRNSKNRKKDDEEEERNSLYNSLNDTKLPAGSEEYVLPSVELLAEGDDFSYDEQTEEVKRKARVLEQTFLNFGFNIRVVEIETGPVIAQYEIEMEAGLRLSKITGLADDLAIALRVPSVRIVAPIPGKNTVGIEVPNEKRQVVRMREVIEEGATQVRKMKIPLFLGKDVSGKPLAVDLAGLPHLLIAGRTGTGKSVCLNSIICSILMARRPDEVRMLMIDPKMVELSGYGRLPHLMHPVVTDMKKAEAILAWAVDKMEDRYALLARAGVRHITSYNQLGRDELRERLRPETEEEAEMIPDHLPFIVIVADEMADLMMTAGKEVEAHIIRLAQKSRAVGIHLILATQKPTVDVITGLIKSNLPARISFQVASRTDSRVVLDENGADKLLGNGDMLFLWPGTSTLLRGKGTYLSDDEINAVVDHCSTGEQNFVQELVQLKVKDDKEEEEGATGGFRKRDDLYEAAVDIVVREGRGSCSLLQRALGIGYGRAARLIDFMAEDGIVGEYAGSQAREVVITVDQWERMRGQPEEASGGGAKRSNKIRRENNWDDAPAVPKSKSTPKSQPVIAVEEEDSEDQAEDEYEEYLEEQEEQEEYEEESEE
ncbi:MAG: DNA translocase FtsK 4TM domain-containing protein [Pirellula sp.]